MSRPHSQKKRPAVLTTSVAALLTLGFLLAAPQAPADEYWDGTNTAGSGTPNGAGGPGTWDNVTTNWVDASGTVPQVYDSNDIAHFATTPGTVTLGDNITFTSLHFDVDGYVINDGGGFTLTPNVNSTIVAPAGVTATINPALVGGGSIVIQGGGTINLAGNSTFTGGTTLNSGRLNIDNTNALGTGTLTIVGGIIGTNVSGTRDVLNNVVGDLQFNNPVSVLGDFSIATNINLADAGLQNLTFNGPVNLNAATRTITGLNAGAQITFTNAISNGGITFDTSAAVNSDPTNDYVSFIYGGSTANTYTGLTTVEGHSFLVLAKSVANGAVQGDIDVEGNGSVDFINGLAGGEQIADTATVTVNSAGITFGGGVHIDGMDLRSANETIATLNGNSVGRIGLGSGTLTIGVGGNFAGVIEDGDTNFENPNHLPGVGVGGGITLNSPTNGTLILGGQSIYTGVTQITAGTIRVNVDNALPSTSAVRVNPGATLDVNDHLQKIGSLADGAGGGGTVTLGSTNGILVAGFDNTSTTFSGVIKDGGNTAGTGGSFFKVGTGTMTISGANTYAGATLVNGGTLRAGATNTIPGNSAVGVNAGATLDLNNLNQTIGSLANDFTTGTGGTVNLGSATLTTGGDNTNTLFSGVIQGTGSVTKLGTGTFSLSGVNTYTGGTTLTAGGITVLGSLASKVTANNATGITTLINGGTIGATGGVSVDATTSSGITIGDFGTFTGAVNLGTGINTVIIAAQIHYTPISASVGTNDTLRLVGGGDDTLKLADFSGYEFLDKLGGGQWRLTDTASFTGGTKIEEGSLNVQGTLISNAVISVKGTLTGTGTLAGNLVNFGAVLPGTPIGAIPNSATPGTFTVKGNYTQKSTGALVIQVNGANAGQYSRLSIGGHAQLDGRLVLQKDGGGTIKLKMGQKVKFLTADGGVSGTFSDVVNPFLGGTIVVAKLVYEPNAVALEGTQGSFTSIESQIHLTYNQTSVARMLDSAATDKRSAKLMTFLDNRQLNQLPDDFNHIAPDEMAAVYRLGVSLADVQARNVQRRTADLRAGASGFSSAGFQANGGPNYSGGVAGPSGDGGKTDATPAADRRWGTFIRGDGDFVHVGESSNASSYELNTGGVTVGADYRLTPKLAVGMTVGYTGTNANLPDDGRLLVNGGKVGVYGTYYTKGFYADAAVTGGASNYSTRRSSLDGDASGSTQGTEVEVMVDTGYDWRLDALTIGPTAQFQYTYVGIDGFTEHGSLTPLRYAGQHQSSIRSTFGLRMAYDWKVGNVIVRPEGQLAWQHEFGDRSYSIDSALASGAGDMFSVADTELGRDSLLFGAGVAVLWNTRTSTYIYYDTDLLKKEYNAQSVTGGLRMNF